MRKDIIPIKMLGIKPGQEFPANPIEIIDLEYYYKFDNHGHCVAERNSFPIRCCCNKKVCTYYDNEPCTIHNTPCKLFICDYLKTHKINKYLKKLSYEYMDIIRRIMKETNEYINLYFLSSFGFYLKNHDLAEKIYLLQITKKDIEIFLGQHPINTGGALSKHTITITEKHDGDIYFEIMIPFWSYNNCVIDSVLSLLLSIRKHFKNNKTFVRDDKIIIHIYKHFCNPD